MPKCLIPERSEVSVSSDSETQTLGLGAHCQLGVGMIHGAHGHVITNPSTFEPLKVRFWSPFERVTTSAASPKCSE